MGDLPDFLQPRLRLFLSADIVGSTALKQSPRESVKNSLEWYTIIQGFYAEAQGQLRGTWDAKVGVVSYFDPGPSPSLWKVIGDEITFTKILTDHRQVAFTLACWCEAMEQVRKFVRRSPSGRLDVKCAAWTAGFPVMNKEVVVRLDGYDGSGNYFRESGALLNKKYAGDEANGYIVDYIGPSIDIGFRLSAHATGRKMIISVGVAYILSLTSSLEKIGLKDHVVKYAGSAPLKGVFGGAPYPLFWIDMAVEGDLALMEDNLTSPQICNLKFVEKYCEKFFDDNKGYTFKPFILSDAEPELKSKPEWYDGVVALLAQNYAEDDLPEMPDEDCGDLGGESPSVSLLDKSKPPTNLDASGIDSARLIADLFRAFVQGPDNQPARPAPDGRRRRASSAEAENRPGKPKASTEHNVEPKPRARKGGKGSSKRRPPSRPKAK